jgi:ABC-2 type transport system ATP-binding protein
MATCISLSKVTKRYGSVTAVAGLSLDIQTGEVLGLLGPNGAGKSTTLYLLAGLVHPTEGAITIFGKDRRKNFIEVASRMGILVERPVFYDYLSVRRNLKMQARLAGRQVNISRILGLVNMAHLADMKAGRLSHGMRQRLGLAQAMLTEPELLILDEPTAGMDVEATQETLRLLRRLATEGKVTIVISSHLMHEVEQLCDRVAIINQGSLVACDRTDALLSYDRSQVEVLLDRIEAAAKRLSEQPWVAGVEMKPGRLFVRLKEDNVQQLTSFLVASGYQVSGIIPRRRTLQEYFLKVMNS